MILKIGKSVIVGTAILGLASLTQGCYRTEAPPDTRSSAVKTEADWFNQKAVELKGDFNKLTPAEQQRAVALQHGNVGNARTGFAMAANFKPNK